MTEKIKRLFNKKCPKPAHKNLMGNYYEFDGKLMKDVDTAFELVKHIYNCGGVVVEHLTQKGTVIFLDEIPSVVAERAKKRGLETCSVDEIYNK